MGSNFQAGPGVALNVRQDVLVDYDLTRLGDREFEHLSQALAIAVLGTHVQVFGDGPDGGREATFDGHTNFFDRGSSNSWSGYGVVQAKFRRRPNPHTDSRWLVDQVRSELRRWTNKKSRRRKMGLPKFLVITTDVYPSSVPETGGIDSVDALIGSYAEDLGIEGWSLWHGDRIARYLDQFESIRRTYAAFITPGDVIASLMENFPSLTDRTVNGVFSFAAKGFMSDQWVRLSQAGSANNEKLSLAQIGTDLPAVASPVSKDPITGVVKHIVKQGDSTLRPSLIGGPSHPHFTIIGGPGQGKTTLSQLVCQVYRAALLADRPRSTLGGAADLLDPFLLHLKDEGIDLPSLRRWPIRVPLSEFGDAISGNSEDSLLRFLAERITARSSDRVTASRLQDWLGSWPWILVLDGLDEIASPKFAQWWRRSSTSSWWTREKSTPTC